MRILLVEDDELLGEALDAGLRQVGHTVDWITDGEAADLALGTEVFDAVVLDLTLPRKDGLEVLKAYRARGGEAPVLILTARDAVPNRIQGLDEGADDYMVKPFDLDELLARLRAVVRRRAGQATPVLRAGRVTLDPAARSVRVDGIEAVLTRFEYTLLELFMQQPNRVLTRARLEDTLYGWGDGAAESNSLDVHIHNLRHKIGRSLIETVRGVGYKLILD